MCIKLVRSLKIIFLYSRVLSLGRYGQISITNIEIRSKTELLGQGDEEFCLLRRTFHSFYPSLYLSFNSVFLKKVRTQDMTDLAKRPLSYCM